VIILVYQSAAEFSEYFESSDSGTDSDCAAVAPEWLA
jgi:hypothetical protein